MINIFGKLIHLLPHYLVRLILSYFLVSEFSIFAYVTSPQPLSEREELEPQPLSEREGLEPKNRKYFRVKVEF